MTPILAAALLAAAPIDDVRAGLKTAENRIRNYTVTATYTATWHSPKFGGQAVGKPVRRENRCIFDRSGKFALDSRGQTPNITTGVLSETHIRGAYDGSAYREESGPPPARAGVIRAVPSAGWGVDPRECLDRYRGQPLSTVLADNQATFVGKEEVDGAAVLFLETVPTFGVDGQVRKYRFAVAPDRGYAVLVRAALRQAPVTGAWLAYAERECSGYRRDAAGIWYPTKSTERWTDIGQDGKVEPLMTVTATLRDWQFNGPLPADAFTLTFAAGVKVTDERPGKGPQKGS